MMGQNPGNPFINIWLKGIQNNRFKDYFINRYADLMNTEYLTDRLLPLENNFFNQIAVEMQKEYARWGNPNDIPQQMTNLYNSHLTFRDELTERSNQVRDHIENNFNLPNQVDLVLDVHPAGAGKIHISTIEPGTYPWNGIYFNGVPIKIEAIANPGFNFSNWGNNGIIANVLSPVYLDTLDVTAIQFDAYFTGSGLGLKEQTEFNGFNIYPNPAQEQAAIVNLKQSTDESLQYQLVDLSGRILETHALSNTQTETLVNLSRYPNAVYLVNIVSGTRMVQQMRIVKTGK
jgi:hypothetical protein